jgi:hypothetical protein
VGRYLTDSVGSDAYGYFPQLEKIPRHNHDGTGGMHMYAFGKLVWPISAVCFGPPLGH